MKTIGDVLIEFKDKKSPDQNPPVLTLTEKKGFVRQDERFKKRLATEDTSKYKLIQFDDFAFNPYLLWAGALARNTISTTGVISPLYPTFRVRPGYDPSYVEKILLSPQMIRKYDTIAFGSVPRRRRSSVNDFLKLTMGTTPPLDEQRRIAATLDVTSGLKIKHKLMFDNLNHLKEEYTQQIFSKEKLDWVCFGDISSNVRNGQSPSTAGKRKQLHLTLSAITGGDFDASFVKVSNYPDSIPHDKFLSDGLFLICRGNGNPKLVGSGVFVGEIEGDIVFPDTIIGADIDLQRITPEYFSAAWSSPQVRHQINRITKTTNGTFKVNQKSLSKISIPLVSQKLQQEFSDICRKIRNTRNLIIRTASMDDFFLEALQSRASRGEL